MCPYCFPELAVFLKISSLWWNMMHALETGFVARMSLFILKTQTDHQCCPQEQSKEIKQCFFHLWCS